MSRDEILKTIKQAIYKIDPNAKVILYGSRARGDEGNWSDWDLLVLTEKPVTATLKDAMIRELFEVELATDQVISCIIHEYDQWPQYKDTPFFQNVEKEGLIL